MICASHMHTHGTTDALEAEGRLDGTTVRGLQDLRPLDVKFRSLRTREESQTLVPILLAYALSLSVCAS